MSSIECYDDYGKLVDIYNAPFDVEIDCYDVEVYGDDLSGMKLRGKCKRFELIWENDYKSIDLSGFMDLEIEKLCIDYNDVGLLKILELNCKNIWSPDKKLSDIMNKYLLEEDPSMRDFEGFKLEMAVNGYGDRL